MTGKGLDARRDRPTVGFVLILAEPLVARTEARCPGYLSP
jgi:hypothetical protein